MPRLVPKPNLRQLVDAIQEETQLAAEMLTPVVGTVTYEVEQTLKQIVTKAIERGIELQRDALKLHDSEHPTPMRPEPLEVEEDEETLKEHLKPPRLPSGVRGTRK